MIKVLENIQDYDKVTSSTNRVVINNITYTVATSGDNARTPETMKELTSVVELAKTSVGTTNESYVALSLSNALNDFVDVFEIVGIE